MAKRRGSHGVTAWLESDHTGYTATRRDRSVLDAAVISAAGTEAANHHRWFAEATTEGDAALLRAECRQAGITQGEAWRLARRDIARHQREINQVARRLYQHGQV